jgi:hypothetical protein
VTEARRARAPRRRITTFTRDLQLGLSRSVSVRPRGRARTATRRQRGFVTMAERAARANMSCASTAPASGTAASGEVASTPSRTSRASPPALVADGANRTEAAHERVGASARPEHDSATTAKSEVVEVTAVTVAAWSPSLTNVTSLTGDSVAGESVPKSSAAGVGTMRAPSTYATPRRGVLAAPSSP